MVVVGQVAGLLRRVEAGQFEPVLAGQLQLLEVLVGLLQQVVEGQLQILVELLQRVVEGQLQLLAGLLQRVVAG